MSFFNNIKRVFGFGADDSEYYAESMEEQALQLPQATGTAAISDAFGTPEVPVEIVSQIFDKVVETFNGALPQFIGQAVDQEKQRIMLYDMLDDSIKQYLLSLETIVQNRFQAKWDAEKQQIVSEADNLRRKAKEMEDKKSEINDRVLSAERQKRALAERLHDLEGQVLQLESDKEQLEIENKCMLNKTKAANVLEKEIEELRATAEALRNRPGELSMEQETRYKAEIESLTKERDKLAEGLETLKVKCRMGDAMVEDWRKKCGEKDEIITLKDAAIAEKDEIITKKDEVIAEKDEIIAEKDVVIAENNASMDEIEEIQKQMEKFEDIKAKMEARYEKTKEILKEAQAENESLRQTIKNNLQQNAQEQKALRERIAVLEEEINRISNEDIVIIENQTSEDEEEYKTEEGDKVNLRKSRKNDPTPTDIDDVMLGTDWLVSHPDEQSSMKVRDEKDDFGYQPPQKKNKIIDNEAQMSLFDF